MGKGAGTKLQSYYETLQDLDSESCPELLEKYNDALLSDGSAMQALRQIYNETLESLRIDCIKALQEWPDRYHSVKDNHYSYEPI